LFLWLCNSNSNYFVVPLFLFYFCSLLLWSVSTSWAVAVIVDVVIAAVVVSVFVVVVLPLLLLFLPCLASFNGPMLASFCHLSNLIANLVNEKTDGSKTPEQFSGVTRVSLGHPLMTVIQGLMLSASSPYCGFSHSVVVIVATMSEPGPSPLFDLNVDQCQAILAKLSNGVPAKQVSDERAHYHYRFSGYGLSLHIDDVSLLQSVHHYARASNWFADTIVI
jgi:hypothetical protein